MLATVTGQSVMPTTNRKPSGRAHKWRELADPSRLEQAALGVLTTDVGPDRVAVAGQRGSVAPRLVEGQSRRVVPPFGKRAP